MFRCVFFGISFFIFAGIPVYAGFGVSPSRVLEENLVKGSTIERVIYIVQGTPEQDLKVAVTIQDSDIKDWISIFPNENFVIPKGIQQFPLAIKITVPTDVPLGIYKGYIRVGTVPDKANVESGGSGVAISVGARIDIDLTVGDKVRSEFAIRNIDLKNIKETEFPRAELRVENTGNVSSGPEEAAFELFNKFGDIRIGYVQGIKLEKVPAFETKNINIEFPVQVKLLPGEYWGTIRLYDADAKLIREFRNVFNVDKATFFDKHKMSIFVGLGVVVLLVIIFFLGRRVGRR